MHSATFSYLFLGFNPWWGIYLIVYPLCFGPLIFKFIAEVGSTILSACSMLNAKNISTNDL